MMLRRARAVALALVLTLVVGTPTSTPGGATPAPEPAPPGSPAGPRPTVTPATGGGGVPVLPGFTAFDPAVVGYQRSEVFLAGTATAYRPTAPFGPDGRFAVEPAGTAPYTTRAVVMRPRNPARFNGTVVVEWLNVSGGADAAPDWMMGHNQLIREGFAWVGISAQQVGVDALRSADPLRGDAVRYAGLSHPGDSYSYDIYSQVGRAVVADAGAILGAGIRPRTVLAVGESQSAIRMVTYIDAVHPLVGVYDGFLVHSRFSGGAPLSQPPLATVPVPPPAPIRDDLDVPVIVFQAEGDVATSGFNRQPDTDRFRLWEVAGTAHFDHYGLVIAPNDVGDLAAKEQMLASLRHPTTQPNPQFTCEKPINAGMASLVLGSAFHWLNRWVVRGHQPPRAARLETTTGTPATAFVTDEHGNVRGGIRTPAVDAPVATLSGLGQGGGGFCFLFGTTTPFPADKVAALYPTHSRFVADWTRATLSAWAQGFLMPVDAVQLIAAAARSDIAR